MMGRQTGDQSQLFYLFNLERRIPTGHLLRRINPIVTRLLADLRKKLAPFYSDIGRPSIDPELMLRMLMVGYCYGIRFERRLCEEVELHLASSARTGNFDERNALNSHSGLNLQQPARFRSPVVWSRIDFSVTNLHARNFFHREDNGSDIIFRMAACSRFDEQLLSHGRQHKADVERFGGPDRAFKILNNSLDRKRRFEISWQDVIRHRSLERVRLTRALP